MPKQKIFIKQEVLIEWDTKEDRKAILQDLKDYPNSQGYRGFGKSFTKTDKPITFIFPKKKKPCK